MMAGDSNSLADIIYKRIVWLISIKEQVSRNADVFLD